MSEKDQNLEWVVGTVDLSSVDISSMWDPETSEVQNSQSLENNPDQQPNDDTDSNQFSDIDVWLDTVKLDDINSATWSEASNINIDENLFLESGENLRIKTRSVDDTEKFGKYLRWFFFSSILTLLWVLWIVLLYSFNTYITKASKPTVDSDYQQYVEQYKDKFSMIKGLIWKNHKLNYLVPDVKSLQSESQVREIINASDIDFIDKKDLLQSYVSELVRLSQDEAKKIDQLKQDIAKQWFLPEELDSILSDDQAIDTIQRSLNALEVIKFSTASRVFSYMSTALQTISEMIRWNGASIDTIRQLLTQISTRWEKDVAAYVYMCYLNPFEINSNCDTIWDLDLYYNSIIKDKSINLSLFKNVMSAINQLLEKEDTSLFSITFNWFNAQDKSITFNIEVFTNKNDERSLIEKWKRNPNIFILTNIVNLLKQSSFIIWADINTKEINVEPRELTIWWFSSIVNYSTIDFTVPIQKDTEREIFDYIDLDSIVKMLKWEDKQKSDVQGVEATSISTDLLDEESQIDAEPELDDLYNSDLESENTQTELEEESEVEDL